MCNEGVWTRAPTTAGGAGWPRVHTRVSSAWSGPEARGLFAVAPWVRAPGSADPGPPGGARSPGARSAEPRVEVGPR